MRALRSASQSDVIEMIRYPDGSGRSLMVNTYAFGITMNIHPLRVELHDEIHTRPRPDVAAPHAIAHLSVLRPRAQAGVRPEALLEWCIRNHIEPPSAHQSHFDTAVGSLRLKWERHGEFDDYTAYTPQCDGNHPFAISPADELLREVVKPDSGQIIAALRLAIVPADDGGFDSARPVRLLGSGIVGAAIADGDAAMFSNFRLDEDGFGRILLIDKATRPSQMGRAVQRLIEIEVYRMMAMLAFPEARELGSSLQRIEIDLAGLVARLDSAGPEEEPRILQDVTRLSASTEQMSTYSVFRFGAAKAYRSLVRQRGQELRQTRLPRLQTFTEFLDRRFEPAMAYCDAVSQRLEAVSTRIGRASDLLGTRVEIERERQNQALLATMNNRAELQLRLQQTVEGLSVAAIAYYATGLVGYVLKAAEKVGLPISHEFGTGLSVLPVILAVWYFMKRVRNQIHHASGEA